MPSGPNAENAKNLYPRGPFNDMAPLVDSLKGLSAYGAPTPKPRPGEMALRISGDIGTRVGQPEVPYKNAMTHEDIDRMYKEHIGTPEPGSLMESNLKAQHDELDRLNAPKYSDRVKARRKARP